ncbi:uncharacterized protein DS421_18g608170 [Arachis hypogaea]|nr:uncharacterized protein DS421_18g608170 [Arachis hypogaea]
MMYYSIAIMIFIITIFLSLDFFSNHSFLSFLLHSAAAISLIDSNSFSIYC